MASGENPDQPRQPRNLQGLLKFAMEATKSEDAPHDAQLQPLDEERRRFLEEALKSLTVDVVQELEKSMNILLDSESDEEAKIEALETVTDFVEDIDTANDFFKVGGFVIIKPGLESSSAEVRSRTLRLIAALAQCNPFCQQHLLELTILPKLIELLADELSVAQDAVSAVSAMVRQYEPCAAAFIDIGGLESIMKCLHSNDEKLSTRSSFLMVSLSKEFAPVMDKFIKLNAIECVLTWIELSDRMLQTGLSVLATFAETKEGVQRCRADSNLKEKLDMIIELGSEKDDYWAPLDFAKTLLKLCYSGEQDGADR
ncbi:hsp70-binding protein 1-like [Anopheles marshallii]|uniref:hsp70-binding protein 1-like n=1 Tax=Anopheles marshallii TaxID=1521116 RepID=UPI00237BFF11|nr:hsp70-binding protein 1-like [Anopheles marshallii]